MSVDVTVVEQEVVEVTVVDGTGAGGTGAVSSVNGHVGIVVLTASDVGAATPTAVTNEATARSNADATNATAITSEASARATADALLIPLTQKAAASGVASLDSGGKVPAGQLPSLVISHSFVVGSQAAMLALAANVGDLAIRTDVNETFILTGADPTQLVNWTQLLFPGGGAVSSVNTRTGNVTGLAENSVTVTGTGALGGGGDLSANRTITHGTNGTAGTYGDATHVVQITTDAYGHVTGATAVAITGLAPSTVTGVAAVKTDNLSVFAATTSAQLKGVLSDETGSGAAVFATSPALVTPTGIVKGDVGLGNVDNTADSAKTFAASAITSGTLGTARLGSGSATSATVLLGNSSWGAPPADPLAVVLYRQQYK